MRWQRIAQAAIALFVIGFIGMLVTSLRRERAVPQQQVAPDRRVPEAPLETRGGGLQEVRDPSGKLQWAVKFRLPFAGGEASGASCEQSVDVARGLQPPRYRAG